MFPRGWSNLIEYAINSLDGLFRLEGIEQHLPKSPHYVWWVIDVAIEARKLLNISKNIVRVWLKQNAGSTRSDVREREGKGSKYHRDLQIIVSQYMLFSSERPIGRRRLSSPIIAFIAAPVGTLLSRRRTMTRCDVDGLFHH